MLYYNGTTSGKWRWPTDHTNKNTFLLNALEEGYDTGNDRLEANGGGHFGWNATNNVWSGKDGANNENGSAVSSTESLGSSDPNWIWVQIDVIIPEDAGEQSISGTLNLYTESV